MSNDCEISMLDRRMMKYDKEQLATPISELKDRVEFVRNMNAKWNFKN